MSGTLSLARVYDVVMIGCKIGSVDNKIIGFTIGIVDEINFGINKSTYVGSLIGTSEIYIDGYIYDSLNGISLGKEHITALACLDGAANGFKLGLKK